jgi:hypothetical protein
MLSELKAPLNTPQRRAYQLPELGTLTSIDVRKGRELCDLLPARHSASLLPGVVSVDYTVLTKIKKNLT